MFAFSFTLPLFQNGPPGQIASTGTKLEIRLAEDKPIHGLIKTYSADSRRNIYLHRTAIVTNLDIIEVRVQRHAVPEYLLEAIKAGTVKLDRDVNELYEVKLRFTEEAGRRMAKATEKHIGKPLAILVGGKVVSAGFLNSRISDEASIVGGDWGFTKQEAERIASFLNNK
jgi:preprotein translocase subunit SecD